MGRELRSVEYSLLNTGTNKCCDNFVGIGQATFITYLRGASQRISAQFFCDSAGIAHAQRSECHIEKVLTSVIARDTLS